MYFKNILYLKTREQHFWVLNELTNGDRRNLACTNNKIILPSTHSCSIREWMTADLSPTQNDERTSTATNRTLPACRWRKQPSWNNCTWSRARNHKAVRRPSALPCIQQNITHCLLITKLSIAEYFCTLLFRRDQHKPRGITPGYYPYYCTRLHGLIQVSCMRTDD